MPSDWFKNLTSVLSTNEKENQNQSWLARAIFPALSASYMELLRPLIGSLRPLHLLWLVEVSTLVFLLRHSIETRSTN